MTNPRRTLSKAQCQSGAAALEYILVSTFAAVATIAALGYVGKLIKHELGQMADKLGLEQPPDIDHAFGP